MNKFVKLTIATMLLMVWIITSKKESFKEVVYIAAEHETAASYNERRANELIDRVFPFAALVEGSHGEGHPYYDNAARWTVWYGTTVKPDGTRVKKNDPWIPKSTGKEWCYHHLRERVFPFFKFFDQKRLSDEQIIGICLFIYNVGGESVTGRRLDGKILGEPSMFFQAVNGGKNDAYCVNCMTRYRRAGNKRANGLLKRHWIQGAAYLGILNAENVLTLQPTAFYQTKNMGNYYWLDSERNLVEKGGVYQLRFDETTVNAFFDMNTAVNGEKSVGDII